MAEAVKKGVDSVEGVEGTIFQVRWAGGSVCGPMHGRMQPPARWCISDIQPCTLGVPHSQHTSTFNSIPVPGSHPASWSLPILPPCRRLPPHTATASLLPR